MIARPVIFAGTANPALAAAIARRAGTRLGRCRIDRFPDGEVSIVIEQRVRGRRVVIVQPTSPPVDEHLVELLAFVDACRRAGAERITAVIPYLGYARADKRHGRLEPITASLVGQLLATAGADDLVTVDLHAPQIEGFFPGPFDALEALPVLCAAVRPGLPADTVVVSPDLGRLTWATEFARRLGAGVAVVHKQRTSGSETAILGLVGDVAQRSCLIVDDMISTGGTVMEAVRSLIAAGARPPFTVAATHGLFVGDARTRLEHPAIGQVLVTDTVALTGGPWPRVTSVSVAPLIADFLRRTY